MESQDIVISAALWRESPTDWHFLPIPSGMIPATLPSVTLTVQETHTVHDES
jgi:hypothetical protein